MHTKICILVLNTVIVVRLCTSECLKVIVPACNIVVAQHYNFFPIPWNAIYMHFSKITHGIIDKDSNSDSNHDTHRMCYSAESVISDTSYTCRRAQ